MKRKILLSLAAALCAAGLSTAQAADTPTVWLDGEQLTFDVAPIIQNDRTMVPYRAIFEELGYTVSWNAQNQSVSAIKGSSSMWMQIGNKNITVNGSNVVSDTAPFIQGDRTLVPLRLVSEYSGCDVLWNGETETVVMYHKQAKNAHSYKIGDSSDICVMTDGVTLLVDKINEAEKIWATQGYSLTDLSPVGTIDFGPVNMVANGIGYGIRRNYLGEDRKIFSVDMETGEILCTADQPFNHYYLDDLLLDPAQNQVYAIANYQKPDCALYHVDSKTLECTEISIPDPENFLYIYDNQIYYRAYPEDKDNTPGSMTCIYDLVDKTIRTIPALHEGEYVGSIVQTGDVLYQRCSYTAPDGTSKLYFKGYNLVTKEIDEFAAPYSALSYDITENSIFYMTNENNGTLYRMSLQGDALTVLADHLFVSGIYPSTMPIGKDVTVIGNTVYFTRGDTPPGYGSYDLSSAVIAVPTCGGEPYILDYWVAMTHHMS